MLQPSFYKDDDARPSTPIFLPEKTYASVLDSLIIVSADIIPIDRERKIVYLATRKVKPCSGLWLIGGRMFVGENEKAAAARCFARETSLKIPDERFGFVSMHRYFFRDRKEAPQNHATDHLAYNFTIKLTPTEIREAGSHLDPEEYEASKGLIAFDRQELISAGVHRAILDLYDTIFLQADFF